METKDINGSNSWSAWRRAVLNELTRQAEAIHDLDDKVNAMATDIAVLKVKAGAWGAVAGVIVVLLELALRLLGGGK